jgi:hypothetical protein
VIKVGYDMTVRGGPQPPPVDYAKPDTIREHMDFRHEQHTYFRRNIFGMGPTRDALERLEMGFWAENWVPLPPFPSLADFGITDVDDEAHYRKVQQDEPWFEYEAISDAAKNFEAATAEHLRWHGPEIPGIPLHKFCSNDGWHVTREECQAALVRYELAIGNGEPHPEEFSDDLIPFLRAGARYDGFEVY